MKRKLFTLLLCLSLAATSLAIGGCSSTPQDSENSPPLSPAKDAEDLVSQEVVLYFGDDQAMYLMPEKRLITIEEDAEDKVVAQAIVTELIAGPKEAALRPTIPPEARLLSVEIKEKVAYVNFTEDIRTKHWGGSAGETMTIMSLVNSLTELQGVNKVQLLIEGEVPESLVGHWYTGEPIERNEEIISQ